MAGRGPLAGRVDADPNLERGSAGVCILVYMYAFRLGMCAWHN